MNKQTECAIYLQKLWLAKASFSTAVYAVHQKFGVALSGYIVEQYYDNWERSSKMLDNQVWEALRGIGAKVS